MTVEQTDRLGVYRWSEGSDPFTRDQMDTSHENLEERAAVFLSGGIGDRPSVPSPEAERMFYLATDQNAPVGILYYSDGNDWQTLNSFGAPVSESPGDSQGEGSASTLARSDHRHAMLPWGASGEVAATSTSNSAGSTAKYARIDHVHQIGNNSVTAGKIAAGGVSSANQLANNVVATAAIQNGAVTQAKLDPNALIPAGTVLPWAGQASTPPTGWLFCDGSAISKTEYANLYSIIGDEYALASSASGEIPNPPSLPDGVIPPNDKFRIPDLRIRFPIGSSTMDNGQISNANDRSITTDTTLLMRSRGVSDNKFDGTTATPVGEVGGTGGKKVFKYSGGDTAAITNPNLTFRSRRNVDSVQNNDTYMGIISPSGSNTDLQLPILQPFLVIQYIIKF
jgi:microcystin-dependent protein